MTENIENIILTHLRAMRDDISDIKTRLSGIDGKIATIMQHQGHIAGDIAQLQVSIDRQSTRISRIEDRLGLVDAL